MRPIKFKEYNVIFAKDQAPYQPLPAYRDEKDIKGSIYHCWQLTFKERFKIIFTGRLWFNVLTFKNPPQPILPMVDSPFGKIKRR